MYWKSREDCQNLVVSAMMKKTVFLECKQHLHLVHNNALNSLDKFAKMRPLFNVIKVAPRVVKTGAFKKVWNFENRAYFASCITKKHYFLLWTKEMAFFPYFYHEIIFYSAELSDCAVNFKFYLNVFYIFKHNTNQISKEQCLNCVKSSDLFWGNS